jgi:hypothetical protein
MTVTAKCLYESTQVAAAETTIYTAPANTRTLLDKLTAVNVSAANVTFIVRLVVAAGTAGGTNTVATMTLGAGQTYNVPEVVGHVLNPGDFVSVLAGAATSINVRMSGREVTT